MKFNEEEIEFIESMLHFYWTQFNSDHLENKKDYELYEQTLKKLTVIHSSLQLNERLKTSFENYKNEHFIDMKDYYIDKYEAKHWSLNQIIDRYLEAFD